MNKLLTILAGILVLSVGVASTPAATNDTTMSAGWGESGKFSKWSRYPSRSYPFTDCLPRLDKFPELLDYPMPNTYVRTILVDQMRTISRCDFLDWRTLDYGAACQKWRAWWSYYGSGLSDRLAREGRTYPEAWEAIAPRGLSCPAYPLALPVAWSFQLSFKSGDYGSIVHEEISMTVSAETATLRRRYQQCTDAPWVTEQWKDLSISESQSFLASLVYAIDNPWIYADDGLATGSHVERPTFPPEGSINGRPKQWSAYYPFVHWTGIMDPEGHVVMNDDVWRWDTTDLESIARGERKNQLDYPIGVVFRVIRDRFPDPTWKPKLSRWSLSKP